jgi:alpha-acetolactate decarboxylase
MTNVLTGRLGYVNTFSSSLHLFSTADNQKGHILDFNVPENTTVEYDMTPEFTMSLPTSGAFAGVDLSKDLSSALAKVEQ